jgi:class 3 adenylate cyclase
MSLDLDALSFTEMIRLRDELSSALHRRFGRDLALVFTDVVGSTNHFARFGDAAGRAMQQRHFDHLAAAIAGRSGRVVDTAGDGAFTVFASMDEAARAMIAMQSAILAGNYGRDRFQRLSVRVGIHWSSALTDGAVVSGDGVNLCARVAGAAEPGGVLVTRAGFSALASDLRPRCRDPQSVSLKGIPYPVEVLRMDWLDLSRFPTHVEVVEARVRVALPEQEVISFGRLHMSDGVIANDVVLTLPDELALQRISRWHFELHRHADGFHVRPVSSQGVEVDGALVAKGDEAPLRPTSELRLGGVMTLRFRREAPKVRGAGIADATVQFNASDDLLPSRTIPDDP